MLLAGIVGGMLWAAVPAWLRSRFHTSEILVSLMLVYVAQLLLSYLVHGPWRDPAGFNFPQSQALAENELLPTLFEGARVTIAFPLALLLAGLAWLFISRTFTGFKMRVAGTAPAAASYAGFGEKSSIWWAMLIGGATAGLAGICEVAGPIGLLSPSVSPGYGFAAIIVAFVGRLDPIGVTFASVLMSMFFIGGELSQSRLGLPKALTGVFQGLLLFALLACDTLIQNRVVWVSRRDSTKAVTS
jgi:simple sugar transport system permease protein